MLNLNYNLTNTLQKGERGELNFAFTASIAAAGAGGGGAAGGLGIGRGGGGSTGQLFNTTNVIVPNLYYTVSQVGVGGAGGINTPGSASGSPGTSTIFTYWRGPDDIDGTITNTLAGGAAGTVGGGDGTGTLFGGQGAATEGPGGTVGGCCRTFTGVFGTTTISGSGGTGGAFQGSIVNPTPGEKGGGGGGAGNNLSTSARGARGGDGYVAVMYNGQPKMIISGGYTDYNSDLNRTTHYITASGGSFIFPYPYPWPDITGSIQ